MPHTQYHTVQPFKRNAGGSLLPLQTRQCSSPEAARALAEKLVIDKRAVGALAYSCEGEASADEFSSPLFLARIGDVPETDVY
jgi:hypothetical protein